MDQLSNSTAAFNGFFHDILCRLIKQGSSDVPILKKSREEFNILILQSIMETLFIQENDKAVKEYLLSREKINLFDLPEHEKAILQNIHVMSFAQVVLYKTLPCPLKDQCPRRPREIAPANQYKDEEFECYFYHHDKDQRRIPIPRKVKDDFFYSANYSKAMDSPNAHKYSLNYFESMFHPIYYKLFYCKRVACEQKYFCPFVHHQSEKAIWDETFRKYILKSRDILTKKKSPYENMQHFKYINHQVDISNNRPLFLSPSPSTTYASTFYHEHINNKINSSKSETVSPLLQTPIIFDNMNGLTMEKASIPNFVRSKEDRVIMPIPQIIKDNPSAKKMMGLFSPVHNNNNHPNNYPETSNFENRSFKKSPVLSHQSDDTTSIETNTSTEKASVLGTSECDDIFNQITNPDLSMFNRFYANINNSNINLCMTPYQQSSPYTGPKNISRPFYPISSSNTTTMINGAQDDTPKFNNNENQPGLNQFFNLSMVSRINQKSLYQNH